MKIGLLFVVIMILQHNVVGSGIQRRQIRIFVQTNTFFLRQQWGLITIVTYCTHRCDSTTSKEFVAAVVFGCTTVDHGQIKNAKYAHRDRRNSQAVVLQILAHSSTNNSRNDTTGNETDPDRNKN
jgi:hypothetical protein